MISKDQIDGRGQRNVRIPNIDPKGNLVTPMKYKISCSLYFG